MIEKEHWFTALRRMTWAVFRHRSSAEIWRGGAVPRVGQNVVEPKVRKQPERYFRAFSLFLTTLQLWYHFYFFMSSKKLKKNPKKQPPPPP
jgi:hypothetical protein